MFKTTLTIVMATLCLNFKGTVQEQNALHFPITQTISGKVISATTGEVLPGAIIKITNTNHATVSNDKGEFILILNKGSYSISVYYLNHKTKNITIQIPLKEPLIIALANDDQNLKEVEIVSTGYQNIPKERATGSFTQINNELLSRSVGINILERLDGVASSLIFNKNRQGVGFNNSQISIRGRSTINGDPNPLIVLDNFPFYGEINTINTNDIESITLLKDAAAASIWGTKAGNGVIVITTKAGRFNQKTTVSLINNFTIGQKPKIFSQQQLNSKEFIEIEKFLFEKGQYNSTINNGYGALSPAVEVLLNHRSSEISLAEQDSTLNSLSQYDTRNDLLRYYYRTPVSQQYQLNISGGSENQKFFLSGGYDKNLTEDIASNYHRITVNATGTYALLKNRAKLVSAIQFTNDKNTIGSGVPLALTTRYPYIKLADKNGNALAVTDGNLRLSYIKSQESKGLLDWHYRPLDELASNGTTLATSLRINNNLTYQINKSLSLSGYHSYQRGITDYERSYDKDTYYTRNLINSISSTNNTTGQVIRPIAPGNILNSTKNTSTNNYGRLQLALDYIFADQHSLSGIAGVEICDNKSNQSSSTLYGYNPENGINSNQLIDYLKDYPRYIGVGTTRVPTGLSNSGLIDRYFSYYTNMAYTFKSKYTLSVSARKDQSNLFGVKSNQKGLPLWSAGIAWELSKESPYNFSLIPYLKLRATYGYSGNVDKSTSAYFTVGPMGSIGRFGAPQLTITNPPNPSLIWEKVKNINLAADFGGKNNKINGSIELYFKHGTDLIGTSPIAPQSGIEEYKGNSASLKTKGLDISIHSKNLLGSLKWNSSILFNYVNDKVTKFLATPGSNLDITNGNYRNPLIGYPYNSIFSFKWGGLDNTGAPRGYIGEQLTTNYTGIRNSSDRNNIIFNGSRSPTIFGSMVNSFSWNYIAFSFMLSYKTGYYLRRSSLSNTALYSSIFFTSPDYNKRWQKPGDELKTSVPSLIYPANSGRESVYTNSEVLIFKGDHIRLQDVRITIDLGHHLAKSLSVKQLTTYIYTNNLGIIWRKNKLNIDPDSPTIDQTKNISFGLKAQF